MEANTRQDMQGGVETRGAHVGAAELAAETLAGAAAGAAMGMLGGPPGMVAGAVLGGAIAAAVGVTLHEEHACESAAEDELDREIGVIGGNIGEASPDAPKSQRGTFHAASMGASSAPGAEPSDGPMQNLSTE
jgi:hypothetical protein